MSDDGCLTIDLAAAVAATLPDHPPGRFWAATFESLPLFRSIKAAAAVCHAGTAATYVVMDAGDGTGAAYILESRGGQVSATPLPEGKFPDGGQPPAGRAIVVTVIGERPDTATVPVVSYEGGLRHGWLPRRPGFVELRNGAVSAAFYLAGEDVTALLEAPPPTMRRATGGRAAAANPFLDLRHPAMLAVVGAAEDAGEAVVFKHAMLPGASLARGPGEEAYRFVPTAAAEGERRRWPANAATLCVRLETDGAGSRYVATRRVGPKVSGDTGELPAVSASTYSGGAATFKAVLRSEGAAPDPAKVTPAPSGR